MSASGPAQVAVVRAHFDRVGVEWGRRYDGPPRRMSDLDLVLRRETAVRMLNGVAVLREKPFRLLDVGCGAGNLLDAWHRPGLAYHGIDLSPEMIAEARRRRPDAAFHVGTASDLPFADGTMDAITCLGVLEYVDDPARVLREMRRVLRSGGDLIVSFPNRASLLRGLSRIEVRVERAASRLLRRLLRRSAPDAPPYRHAAWTPRGAVRLLEGAGFEPRARRFNTYGLGGRLGRGRPAIWLSERLSRAVDGDWALPRVCACTMVIRARAIKGGAPA